MTLSTTEGSIVFACYSRACAPPPVGRGGSTKGGRKGGSVIRKSGGGDSSTTKSVARAGAKALSARFGTKRQGSADRGNTSTSVKRADKNRPGGVGGSSVGKAAKGAKKTGPDGKTFSGKTDSGGWDKQSGSGAKTGRGAQQIQSPWKGNANVLVRKQGGKNVVTFKKGPKESNRTYSSFKAAEAAARRWYDQQPD
jgi:hypothetical protein